MQFCVAKKYKKLNKKHTGSKLSSIATFYLVTFAFVIETDANYRRSFSAKQVQQKRAIMILIVIIVYYCFGCCCCWIVPGRWRPRPVRCCRTRWSRGRDCCRPACRLGSICSSWRNWRVWRSSSRCRAAALRRRRAAVASRRCAAGRTGYSDDRRRQTPVSDRTWSCRCRRRRCRRNRGRSRRRNSPPNWTCNGDQPADERYWNVPTSRVISFPLLSLTSISIVFLTFLCFVNFVFVTFCSTTRVPHTTHGDLLVPRTRTVTYGSQSFAVSCPTVWNTLPSTLRVSTTTLRQFQSSSSSSKYICKAHYI